MCLKDEVEQNPPSPKQMAEYETRGSSLKGRADSVYKLTEPHQDGSQYPTDGTSSV